MIVCSASAGYRAIGLCVGLAAYSGCTRAPDLDLDFGDRTNACGLLVSHDDRNVFAASVLELRDGQIVPADFRFRFESGAQATWLVGSASARTLELEAGALELTTVGRVLPRFEDMFSADPGGSFERVALLPPAVEAIRIPVRCGLPEVQRVDLPSQASSARVLASGDLVTIVTSDLEVYVLDEHLTLTAPVWRGAAVPRLAYDTTISVEGQLWTVAENCVLQVYASSTTIEDLRTGLCASWNVVGAGSFDGKHFMSHLSDGDGEFVEAGSLPISIGYIGSTGLPIAGPHREYWLRALTIQDIIAVASDGTVTYEPVPILAEHITALDYVPGFGLLAGDSGGNVFQRGEDGRWTHLGDPGFFYGVSAFAPFRDGFVVAGGTTEGARYIPGHGFCELASLSAGPTTSIAPLGEGLVFASYKHPHSQSLAITWVRFVD